MEMTRNTGDQISPGRLRLCMIEEERSAGETGKCIKRRRYPSTFALSCNIIDQQIDQQQLRQSPGDRTAAVATTVERSSRFRGVSRHRWTGRFEAHSRDKAAWNPAQRKKGKQEASDYEEETEIMKTVAKEEHLASFRRSVLEHSRH